MKAGLPFVAVFLAALTAGAYEIGEESGKEAFWKSDPVLFVKNHAEAGFEFTSDQREGADSRQDGGVTYHGLPVYESKISFGDAGGIERIELLLYASGGTETLKEFEDDNGRKFRRRERVEKRMSRAEFFETLETVRKKLTKAGAKAPAIEKAKLIKGSSAHRHSQTWPRTDLPTQATLTWNYEQDGKKEQTFKPAFIRVEINGPARLATSGRAAKSRPKKTVTEGARKILDNVIRDPRGDVLIDNVPMVDQGQKGYCSVATAERVLRYYGLEIDEHEIAQAAGTTAEGGTSTLAMKKSVESIGKRYRLATVVCYGDFEKSSTERIAGICDEVKAYNKAAKKMKKPVIADEVFIRREGNTTFYSSAAADAAMDVEVLKEMKVNGVQKPKFAKFQKDIHVQIDKGIPLIWGVTLGTYPEPGLMQTKGGHMRLIIGYNDKKKEILYTDSWGAGHELKRMPVEWAWTISHCLMYMKPLL